MRRRVRRNVRRRDITFDEIFDNARFVAPFLATCPERGARAVHPTDVSPLSQPGSAQRLFNALLLSSAYQTSA